MGIEAATAYLTHIREIRAENGPISIGTIRVDRWSQTDQQILYLLTVGHALGVDLAAFTALLIDPADDGDAQIAATFLAEDTVRRRIHPLMRQIRSTSLTESDIDLLQSLAMGRLLQAEALEWLHFTWHARYTAYQEHAQHDHTVRYEPSLALYTRLIALCVRGYVQHTIPIVGSASTQRVPVPDAYALTQAGADVLKRRRALPEHAFWTEAFSECVIQHLEHSAAIGRLYAALHCAAAHHTEATVRGWQGNHVLDNTHAYDQIVVQGYRLSLGIYPDATALITTASGTQQRVFVEMDVGSYSGQSWKTKIAAYQAYSGSTQLETRYGVDDFVVLIVVENAKRLERIAKEVVRALGEPHDRYLFLIADDVHPTTIVTNWQRISDVRWQRLVEPAGSVIQMPTITLEQVSLWTCSIKE